MRTIRFSGRFRGRFNGRFNGRSIGSPALYVVAGLLVGTFFTGWRFEGDERPLMGFIKSTSERELEKEFDANLKADDLDTWMKHLSARPHNLGSAYDKENAEYLASLFKSWGYETEIEEFSALYPTPKTRILELLEPDKFTAALVEPPLPEDATTDQASEQLPVYNAYSIDGDVTGELVYVNFGIPKDYEELEQRGISVKGKIAIARYGGSWRGIKPKVAAEHGALGCIIYSDPHEDGYFEGDVYPKGAYRSDRGAQRGSVADMPLYAGDPSTPGVGAVKGVKRLALKDVQTLTKIPVLPISYGDALPLLRSIAGQVAPDEWRGALPMTYHLGPGPAKVHMKLEFNWNIVPVFDVVARIKGSERPQEWIIRGNHHDAWVNGAADPISGLVALLAEAKSIGALSAKGKKPKRTIIFAAWDGEEPGLIGSTEWVETHADELRKHAAVYINTDGNARGFFGASGSHSLETFVNEVSHDVTDPQTQVSVFDRMKAERLVNASTDERKELHDKSEFPIGALGSGSDFTPFLQHLGIASLNLGYGGEDGGGSYHSIYDTYSHYTRFSDPGFRYGVTLAQTSGRMVLRLANADVLPFAFGNFAETVGKYLKEVTKLADDMREETDEQNKMLKDKMFTLAADPTQTYIGPRTKDPVPYLNFSPLLNGMTSLRQHCKVSGDGLQEVRSGSLKFSVAELSSLDDMLMMQERSLTRPEGIPRRSWFTHFIYAPGFYTGYGVKTLPGIREAIEQRNWKEADEQIGVCANVLSEYDRGIERIIQFMDAGRAKTPAGSK